MIINLLLLSPKPYHIQHASTFKTADLSSDNISNQESCQSEPFNLPSIQSTDHCETYDRKSLVQPYNKVTFQASNARTEWRANDKSAFEAPNSEAE